VANNLRQEIVLLDEKHGEGHCKTKKELQSHLGSQVNEIKSALSKGDQNIGGVEQRVNERISEHESGTGKRLELSQEQLERQQRQLEVALEQRHRDLALAIAARDEAVEAKLNEALEAPLGVQRECGHRLNVVAYSLLEVIGEAELSGTVSEQREKRAKLHQHLCDRLGSSRQVLEPVSEQRVMQPMPPPPIPSAPLPSSHSTVPHGVKSIRPPEEQPVVEAPGRLPPVQGPNTPRRNGRISDGLRDIRSMRLGDYASEEFEGSGPRPGGRY